MVSSSSGRSSVRSCAGATANSLWAVRLDAGSIGPAIRSLNGTYDAQWFFDSVEMETLPTATKVAGAWQDIVYCFSWCFGSGVSQRCQNVSDFSLDLAPIVVICAMGKEPLVMADRTARLRSCIAIVRQGTTNRRERCCALNIPTGPIAPVVSTVRVKTSRASCAPSVRVLE